MSINKSGSSKMQKMASMGRTLSDASVYFN